MQYKLQELEMGAADLHRLYSTMPLTDERRKK